MKKKTNVCDENDLYAVVLLFIFRRFRRGNMSEERLLFPLKIIFELIEELNQSCSRTVAIADEVSVAIAKVTAITHSW